ncbi:DUF3299 domain-containing protein [Fulvivirga maritima]|uniref:DUF3299 domain-containing protein n=1 Tax=Fulvivirga maritima TaxID=2904247 RepID=UPI001F4293F8|nr:DUF3299 domain-containing protein [Fulvivirga maritima]UII26025.1 DUF3299 domain-containing protein [Fulvivirga maritima]
MLRTIIITIFLLIGNEAISQTKITWKTLGDVTFTDKYSDEVEAYYYYPHFGEHIKNLEGKQVYLKGYILEVDPKEDLYVLSRNPYASCFFCGNGGPESIVELELSSDHPPFKMDQVITIQGVLKLNQDDIYHCNYILAQAKVFSP